MCLFTDIQTLESIDESRILTYLENVCGYVVLPQTRLKEIETLLERANQLAYNKGRISLHNEIKTLLTNG